MRRLRLLVASVVLLLAQPIGANAMGSGPHTKAPYGVTPTPEVAKSLLMPLWVIPAFMFAGMVLWSLPPTGKK